MDIGFIGLGKMGFPMARRLIEAGHHLVVFDTRKEAVEALVARGAIAATSPKDVADRTETVLASLPSLQASLDVRVMISRLRRRLLAVTNAGDITPAQASVLTRIGRGEVTPVAQGMAPGEAYIEMRQGGATLWLGIDEEFDETGRVTISGGGGGGDGGPVHATNVQMNPALSIDGASRATVQAASCRASSPSCCGRRWPRSAPRATAPCARPPRSPRARSARHARPAPRRGRRRCSRRRH